MKIQYNEEDLLSAELELVPSFKAKDVGLDKVWSVPTDRMTEFVLTQL